MTTTAAAMSTTPTMAATTVTTTAATVTTTATSAKRQSGRKQDCHYNRHRQSKLRRHQSPPFANEHDIARTFNSTSVLSKGSKFSDENDQTHSDDNRS